MADLPPSSDAPTNGVAMENLCPSLGSKRQRRPSVRLGDIGEPSAAAAISYEAYVRRTKQWRPAGGHPPPLPVKASAAAASSLSKTRPLVNLGNGDSHEPPELRDVKTHQSGGDLDSLPAGGPPRRGKETKAKRGPPMGFKRARSNWGARVDESAEAEHEKLSGDDGGIAGDDEGFREYDPDGSDSPSKEHSPIRSMENAPVDLRPAGDKAHGSEKEGNFPRRAVRGGVPEARDAEGIELELPSDMDGGDWQCGMSMERNGSRGDRRYPSLDDGVRMWLGGLGLIRYTQVFEIHEVDDEVLPYLTLEDLKEMGINAVGSRRKMFCSIQKLRKGFS